MKHIYCGNFIQVSRLHSRCSGKNGFDARPHPGPLPRGEGGAIGRAEFFDTRHAVAALRFFRECSGRFGCSVRRRVRLPKFLPLPGGEGRGEGGQKHHLIFSAKFPPAENRREL